MDLKPFRDRRLVIAAAGAVLVLFTAIGVATTVFGHREPAPLSSSGSLQVEMGRSHDTGLDVSRPLNCFVGGHFVGMASLGDCARKNGVAPGGLDVGLDPSGAVAGAVPDAGALPSDAGPPDSPLPEPAETAADADTDAAPAPAPIPSARGGACWRYLGYWRKVADGASLDSCVQALFAGRCERPGVADYGRWDRDTLRLVDGRVEQASDNRTFHTLVKQWQEDCAIPNLQE